MVAIVISGGRTGTFLRANLKTDVMWGTEEP